MMMTRFHETIDTLRLERDEACAEIARLKREIARLAAPPGASAMERAEQLVYAHADIFHPHQLEAIAPIARAIEDAERRGREAMREELGIGEIVMVSEQRNRSELPTRWCALARGRKQAAIADSEEEARAAAIALPLDPAKPHDG